MPMTAIGYSALERRAKALREEVCGCMMHSRETPHQSMDELFEVDTDGQQRALAATQLGATIQMLNMSYPVAPPTTTDKAQVGHTVRLRKDESAEQTYLLCGANEPQDVWSGYSILSAASPVGSKVIGKVVGADFTVVIKGKECWFELTEIMLTEPPKSKEPYVEETTSGEPELQFDLSQRIVTG